MALNVASANRPTRQPRGPTDATAPNRNGANALRDCIPPPKASSQVSVRTSPASTATRTKLPHVFRTDPDAARPLFHVCAGHRPATQGSEDRQERATFDTPTGYQKRPRPAFPQVRGPFSTWWQVKDSNLRSFRDGFTDHGRHAPDQRKRPFHRQLTCVFPTNSRRQPRPTGQFRTRERSNRGRK